MSREGSPGVVSLDDDRSSSTGPNRPTKPLTLLERRLSKFRDDITNTLSDDDDDDELFDARINEHVDKAEEWMPRHDEVMATLRSALHGVWDTRETLEAIVADPSKDDGADTNLQLADKLLSRWEATDRPSLLKIVERASVVWYHPIKREPGSSKVSDITAVFDRLFVEVNKAKISAGISSNPTKQTAGDIRLAPAKKSAQLLDVTKFVAEKFNGQGDATGKLTSYRSWKTHWDNALDYMRNECSDFKPEILFPKLMSSLGGEALDLVSRIPPGSSKAYEEALDKLEQKYGNPIALASACFEELLVPHEDETAEMQHERIKDGFIQLEALEETIVNEGIKLLDFVCIQSTLRSLPEIAKNDWQAHTMDLELAHKRKEAATKWRQGKAINRQTFLGWHKSFALKNKKEDKASNVFLASGKPKSSQPVSAPRKV